MLRVLVTGMGGELGTAVAQLVEAHPDVDEVVGIDLFPPRRRLVKAHFHRIDPHNQQRIAAVVHDFAPTALVHLGVYEPHSRSTPQAAVARTASGTVAAVGAAVGAGSLTRIVVRSGVEVYGRRRGSPLRPDEEAPTDPTCAFGHSLLNVEQVCREAGARADVPVTALRFAPVMGPHVPSPLGRLLRLPAVPFAPFSDPVFSVVHQDDVAASFVAGLERGHDGPVNVVAPGAVTVTQAARLGGRIPVPVVGPGWRGARALAQFVGAPVPEHVHELLVRGRTADGSRAVEVLGVRPQRATPVIVEQIYAWEAVHYVTRMVA
jgi:UDP-glucose 4-epimerase